MAVAGRGLWLGWVRGGSHSVTGSVHLLPDLAPGGRCAGGRLPAQPQQEQAGGPPLDLVCRKRKALCLPPRTRPPALRDAEELSAAACFLVLPWSFRFQISLFLKPSQSGPGFSEI